MATLLSPGVEVTVIDESFYDSSGPGTVPLIILATRENKTNPSGTNIAKWTTAEYAGKLLTVTSQRELIQNFGNPVFRNHGDPTNEYGLLAAHSYLGIANKAFLVRADIDLAQLEPSDTIPNQEPVNGTFWLDLSNTRIGLFEFDQAANKWNPVTVSYLTDLSLLDTNGVPLPSAPGAVGSYLVVPGTVQGAGLGREENQVFRRNVSGWELLDASAISERLVYRSHTQIPISGEVILLNLINGGTNYAVGDTITFAASPGEVPCSILVTNLDGTAVTNASVVNGGLGYTVGDTLVVDFPGSDKAVLSVTAETGGVITGVSVVSGGTYVSKPQGPVPVTGGTGSGATFDLDYDSTGVSDFSIINRGTGYTNGNLTQASTTGSGTGIDVSASVLNDRSLWIKTTEPDLGTKFSVKWYNSDSGQFIVEDAPLARSRDEALLYYGNNPQSGDIFVHYDHNNEYVGTSLEDANARAEFSVMRHNGKGTTDLVGVPYDKTSAPVNDGDALIINGVYVEFNNTLNPGQPLELVDTATDSGIVGVINNANLTGLTASASANNELVLTHSGGLDIKIVDAINTPSVVLFGPNPSEIVITNGFVYSNWEYLIYEASKDAPSGELKDGTLWYSNDIKVDLLVNNGQGAWDEFTGNLFIQPSEPTAGVAVGDLWIDTDKHDNYPVIYRFDGVEWLEIDKTDQTSPNGILFADARPQPLFGTNAGQNNSGVPGYPDLDADRPDPLLYPRGMILFNTRYSTLNVKKWVKDYTFEGVLIGDRWVNESGNKEDGSPYMGNEARQKVIATAMAKAINSNENIRAESIFYNLIASPGYPEMIDEMVSLNYDRGLTCFVVGDVPFTVPDNSTDLLEWVSNAKNAPVNSKDGLVTFDTYLGVYYPGAAITSDLFGNDVVVPSSHIVLRTIAYNDQVAYQWFAPAGYERGVVSNAVSVGYLNKENEYVPVELNQGQRDILYTNKVNPISFRPNRGLVVFGQKTRHPVDSALDRINVTRLINYMRYLAPQLAEPFLFTQNDDITRRNVTSVFERWLEELVTLRAVYDYAVVCNDSNNTPARISRNELWVDLIVQPVKSVEMIYIPVRLRNNGSSLSLDG